MGRFLPCLAFYFKYIFGSTVSSSFVISKCRCGSSAISNDAEFPTVPKLCPLFTFSPSFTNSVVSRFAYIVLYPSLCSIITVIGAFKLFTEVYSTTAGGPGNSTQVLGLFLYQNAFLHDDLGMAAVTGVFIFVITMVLSVIQLKVSRSGEV